MVQWVKRNIFGAFLLNILISILTVSIALLFLYIQYGKKINVVYKNSELIKEIIIRLPSKCDE